MSDIYLCNECNNYTDTESGIIFCEKCKLIVHVLYGEVVYSSIFFDKRVDKRWFRKEFHFSKDDSYTITSDQKYKIIIPYPIHIKIENNILLTKEFIQKLNSLSVLL